MASTRSWRQVARETAARTIRFSGAPRIVRRARARGHAAVLFYHDPSPDVLAQHLAYLADRFNFITLDEVVSAVERDDWSAVPERAVALTFDDGHRGNYALLPLFRRYEIRPTIYLCSQIVATTRHFWFTEPTEVQALKRVRSADRLAALARATGFAPDRSYPAAERQSLSREELIEMAPWVDIGAHTRFHPILTQCDDQEAWQEIEGSKRDLQALFERPIRHFCYPNGDYLAREMTYARQAGFASARTTDIGWVGRRHDPFRLPTIGITDDATVDMLAAQLTGIPTYLRRLASGSFDGRLRPHVPPPG